MKKTDKWKFAIGTTSRVPRDYVLCSYWNIHYLIMDFDGIKFPEVFRRVNRALPKTCQWFAQPTKNGWHVYTSIKCDSVESVAKLARKAKADPAWIRIGIKRGYFFLADKDDMPLPWPVERMAIWQDRR